MYTTAIILVAIPKLTILQLFNVVLLRLGGHPLMLGNLQTSC